MDAAAAAIAVVGRREGRALRGLTGGTAALTTVRRTLLGRQHDQSQS